MKRVFVKGLGLWTPGFGSADAWCRGNPDPEITKPDAALLKGALKRRSSELTRIAVEVYNQATLQAGCSPSSIPSVWATAHGEHSTALRLLGMMHEGEGKGLSNEFSQLCSQYGGGLRFHFNKQHIAFHNVDGRK